MAPEEAEATGIVDLRNVVFDVVKNYPSMFIVPNDRSDVSVNCPRHLASLLSQPIHRKIKILQLSLRKNQLLC